MRFAIGGSSRPMSFFARSLNSIREAKLILHFLQGIGFACTLADEFPLFLSEV